MLKSGIVRDVWIKYWFIQADMNLKKNRIIFGRASGRKERLFLELVLEGSEGYVGDVLA